MRGENTPHFFGGFLCKCSNCFIILSYFTFSMIVGLLNLPIN